MVAQSVRVVVLSRSTGAVWVLSAVESSGGHPLAMTWFVVLKGVATVSATRPVGLVCHLELHRAGPRKTCPGVGYAMQFRAAHHAEAGSTTRPVGPESTSARVVTSRYQEGRADSQRA